MKSDIRVCRRPAHDRPVYTLGDVCPGCGEPTENSAPAPFDPADPYGEYRRRARGRGDDGTTGDSTADAGGGG